MTILLLVILAAALVGYGVERGRRGGVSSEA